MHAMYPGLTALALALTFGTLTPGAHDVARSAAVQRRWLPFIGAGTFLVAAYLRSSLSAQVRPRAIALTQ